MVLFKYKNKNFFILNPNLKDAVPIMGGGNQFSIVLKKTKFSFFSTLHAQMNLMI